jgi:hypothetical protein
MKAPTITPAYVAIYAGLCDIARKHGYALAIHGSVATDMDLLAVPWTEEAVSGEDLIAALAAHISKCTTDFDPTPGAMGMPDERLYSLTPEVRSHGRIAWLLAYKWVALDISVMPRVESQPISLPAIHDRIDLQQKLNGAT